MNDEDSSILIQKAQSGDATAQQELLLLHRDRLKRMIVMFLDQRIAARVDASDVLQETLTRAAVKLPSYLDEQPVEFYPWLRQIAKQQLYDVHRRHIHSQRRSVLREQHFGTNLTDASTNQIIEHLVKSEASPSSQAGQREMKRRLKECFSTIDESDREILLMRFVEHLSVSEISQVLELTVPAAQSRLRRSLIRLSAIMVNPDEKPT